MIRIKVDLPNFGDLPSFGEYKIKAMNEKTAKACDEIRARKFRELWDRIIKEAREKIEDER